MKSRTRCWFLLPTALLLASFRSHDVKPADSFGMTGQQFWRTPFGSGPWASLAGDADGDGRADLLAVGASGDSIIALARTSPNGKPLPDNVAHASVGAGVVAIASGAFFPDVAAVDVVEVFGDGSIKIAWGMGSGTNTYPYSTPAGQISSVMVPTSPSRSTVADFDGDGKLDIVVLGKDGRLLLLRNLTSGSMPKFAPIPLDSNLRSVRRIAAGTLGSEKKGRLVWLDDSGAVRTATVEATSNTSADLGPAKVLVNALSDDHIAVGRFRGAKGADLLVGQRLYVGGDPKTVLTMRDIPATAIAKDDGAWETADIDGNGKDDLIRHREGNERLGGQDVYIHFSYDASDPAKGFYCSANDGLPDVWKIGKIKPNGLDLAAMGCKVGRRDIVIEIERFDNENEAKLRENMDRVVRYFASLPVKNPDGTTGIAVHMIYRTPWPLAKEGEVNAHFDELFPPVEHRGIVHSAFTRSGGPLVSQICGDHGKTNEGWAEFLHEFGHQIDLRHDAFYPSQSPGFGFDVGCALYSSLMSYSYSYTVDGSHDRIGYSDGSFTSFPVNERHLSERLPFPIDKVHFLAGPPYRFRIQAAPDGKSTLVDWNWNGIFDEKEVMADTNYTHGVDFGPQYQIGKTSVAPCLTVHGDMPILIYGKDSRLTARSWLGTNRDTEGGNWSDEVSNLAAGITGDPTAAYLDGITWVAYPTDKGTVLRPITIGGLRRPSLGTAIPIPGTVGTQPTIVAVDGKLMLLLWRSKDLPVRLITFQAKGTVLTMGSERPLDFVSDVPVGAVAGPVTKDGPSLWIGRIQSDGKENGGRTEVVRYVLKANGAIDAAYRSWMGGTYSRHRMTLLWRPEPGNLPEGRIYQLSGGTEQDQWITMNVPYADESGGWFFRRYQQPGFKSLSAPGGCFFQDDILYAFRCIGSDDLRVAFYGSGAGPAPLGDYNDIAHICDYGLSRSIRGLLK